MRACLTRLPLALALLVSLAWPAPGLADPEARVGGETRRAAPAAAADEDASPPVGSEEDRALQAAGKAVSDAIALERSEAARLQQRVRGLRLLDRLAAAPADGPAGPEADERLRLRAQLQADWTRSYELLTRPWPIDPTRGCAYPLLHLDGALRAADDPAVQAQRTEARTDLRGCVDKATFAVAAMRDANLGLRASAAAAERALTPGRRQEVEGAHQAREDAEADHREGPARPRGPGEATGP